MQERRVLVCRFRDDPNVLDIFGIKDNLSLKKYIGVNYHFDSMTTLRICSCEFFSNYVEIDITHSQKKNMLVNGNEKSEVEFEGNIYIGRKKYSEKDKKHPLAYERKDLKTTITFRANILTPQQMESDFYQSITFLQSTPTHSFENFFDYLKSEIDIYRQNLEVKENTTPSSFKTPLPVKRKIASV